MSCGDDAMRCATRWVPCGVTACRMRLKCNTNTKVAIALVHRAGAGTARADRQPNATTRRQSAARKKGNYLRPVMMSKY